jgi:transcriptional regulator of heat shock response
MADWQAIKTEYITTETSYRKLAQKHGVSYQAICHRSKDEGWIAAREQHLNDTVSKTLDKISQQKADRAAKVQIVADKLLNKIDAIVDTMAPNALNTKAIRALTAAVKDLKEIQGVKSDLDEKEQMARIANLEKQADKTDDNKEPIKVIIGDDLSDYSK